MQYLMRRLRSLPKRQAGVDMTWIGIKLFFSNAWEKIKQVPHWALASIGLLVGVVFSLMRRNASVKEALETQKEISEVEKDRAEQITSIEETSRREEAEIRSAHKEKVEELETREKEIDSAELSGADRVAEEWNKHLSEGKDK